MHGDTVMLASRHLDSVVGFGREGILRLLDRSEELKRVPLDPGRLAGRVLGLLFFQSSTRTRFGFHAAMARLGGTAIEFDSSRYDPGMSRAESLEDTVRSISSYCDAIVLRHGDAECFEAAMAASSVPVINGGSGTDRHPTQALIDLFAIRSRIGHLEGLQIGLAGDLAGSRAARSLVRALRYFPPAELRLMAPADRSLAPPSLEGLPEEAVQRLDVLDVEGLDVLYMAGFPEGRGDSWMGEEMRAAFRLTLRKARGLRDSAVVLCPLPRIDEIEVGVDKMVQAAYFVQSKEGLVVRMATLERILE